VEQGLRSVILFGVPTKKAKDECATLADDEEGPVIVFYFRLFTLPLMYVCVSIPHMVTVVF